MLLENSFVFIMCISVSQCLNIAAIFPHCGKSHFLVYEPLLRKLALNGHNVTVISFFPQKNSLVNYRDILDGSEIVSSGNYITIQTQTFLKLEMYAGPALLKSFAEYSCPVMGQSSRVHNFLKENNKFDVILMEFFNSDCVAGITKLLSAPIIGFSTCVNPPFVNSMFGATNHPAYIPNVFLDHSDKKTFLQRLEATLFLGFTALYYHFFMSKPGNEYSKKYFDVDVLKENIMYNASLLLTNTHYSFNRPKPLPPNVIEVAGIHIEEAKKLPENFQKFLDDSPQGIMYMSMGTMLKGTSFPLEKRKIFLKVFSRLRQRVIWKWENETMDEKSDNVMITKWSPQRDILCHPNVKGFISHGGLLGTLEAVHCGVPIIVMPQFGDQHTNAAAIEAAGSGIKLMLSEVTEENLYSTLNKVLSKELQQKAKDLSERFKDRPLSPMDTAIYWIEYVARHKGARYMRTAATDMPFYQYYLLDVFGFLLTVISAFVYVNCVTVSFLWNKLFSNKSKVKTN